ncbi:hypothetical protein CXB51_000379 [Gossypium anomalum]|uniref:Uncharacterized protein n=1 Tax=Gossypium anomalum TaxID=47600 RepID=A0A8J5ZNB8_9ROSI|nr:hypothetical protein CXB51_000379 [Gossypium anomalum]
MEKLQANEHTYGCWSKTISQEGYEQVSETDYRSLVGCLLYLTQLGQTSCLLLVCYQGLCIAVTNNTFKPAKRVLRYIKGTLSYGLKFSRNEDLKLIGYTDSDWAGSKDDTKSTSEDQVDDIFTKVPMYFKELITSFSFVYKFSFVSSNVISVLGAMSDRVCNRNNDLRYLAVNDNQLEGTLLLSLTNCSELVFLNVTDNNLSDTFPRWLGILPQLRAYCQPFLPNLKALKEAEYVDNGNWYSLVVNLTIKGLELEFTLKVRMPLLTCIDLSMNGFHGEIPKVVGELRLLQALNLSHNSLTGPIPPSFGNLSALESLDLSFNKLSGKIPSQLTNLTFLEVLRFWNNNLVGPIPHGK